MIGMPNHDMSRSLDDFKAIGAVKTPKVALPPPEARSSHALQESLDPDHTLN
jgi:hypothetical protein